jgi:hypothetical protein
MGDTPSEADRTAVNPQQEELEERFRLALEGVAENPRDIKNLLLTASTAEQLGRKHETFLYYQRALELDPSLKFAIAKLRQAAVTPEQLQIVNRLARRPASFARSLDGLFMYPLRGSGLPMLLLGTVFFYAVELILWLSGFSFFFMAIGLIVAVLMSAYQSMFFVSVLNKSATGDDDLPGWPDITAGEMISDLLKFVGAAVIAFLPVWVCLAAAIFMTASAVHRGVSDFAQQVENAPDTGVLAIIALLSLPVGILYYPMALLSNSIFGTPLVSFNPVFVFRSIVGSMKDYLICTLVFFVSFIAVLLLKAFFNALPLPFITGIFVMFIGLYATTLEMRLLGVFYRYNQAKLKWMTG